MADDVESAEVDGEESVSALDEGIGESGLVGSKVVISAIVEELKNVATGLSRVVGAFIVVAVAVGFFNVVIVAASSGSAKIATLVEMASAAF